MTPAKVSQQRKTLPPPGRKVGIREALERTNQKYHKALGRLAK